MTSTLDISSNIILSSLWNLSPDAFFLADSDLNLIDINESGCKLIGQDRNNLIGKNLRNLIILKDINDDFSIIDRNTVAIPMIRTFFNNKGSDLQLLSSVYPIIKDSEGIEAVLVIAYVAQSNTVQQAQTEFVSTVSHELRTPLTSIKGFADTILRSQAKLDANQIKRYVGIIKDQSDRLTRLVENLLAVSRLESKKNELTIRSIDTNDAIRRVCQNLAVKALNHNLIINIPQHISPVFADSDKLEQILTNLIDNALKYSQPKTTVTISAQEILDKEGNNFVQINVNDQGVGIEEKHLPQIFTKFSRLDNPLIRQTEGTGLGLYITRSLVLSLGGHIYVKSKPGDTTFTIELPVATFEEQAARGRDQLI